MGNDVLFRISGNMFPNFLTGLNQKGVLNYNVPNLLNYMPNSCSNGFPIINYQFQLPSFMNLSNYLLGFPNMNNFSCMCNPSFTVNPMYPLFPYSQNVINGLSLLKSMPCCCGNIGIDPYLQNIMEALPPLSSSPWMNNIGIDPRIQNIMAALPPLSCSPGMYNFWSWF